MKRRSFFSRLLGTVAAITVASAAEVFGSQSSGFKPCLHAPIKIPTEWPSENGYVVGFDPAYANGEQFYPATTFEVWKPYLVK